MDEENKASVDDDDIVKKISALLDDGEEEEVSALLSSMPREEIAACLMRLEGDKRVDAFLLLDRSVALDLIRETNDDPETSFLHDLRA